MKLEKDKVIKDIEDRGLVSDYIAAGWTIVKESPEIKSKPKEVIGLRNEKDRV